jgi:hypothetical protein
MKTWTLLSLAAALAITVSVSAEPALAQSTAPYADARSTASDEEVRVARRAYRAACQQNENEGYCECMTGGMAQALTLPDLAIATAAFSGQNVAGSAEARARVEAIRADVDRGCAQFRSEP